MMHEQADIEHEEAAVADAGEDAPAAADAPDGDPGYKDRDTDGIAGTDAPEDAERAFGDFHRQVDRFAQEFRAQLDVPEALESYNAEMDALSRFKAPGFDEVMQLTEAGGRPAVVETGRALARRILQLETELAAIRGGAGEVEVSRSRQALEDEWRSLRDKPDYWTNPAVQRRSREIAEALFGTDPVGAGATRTAVGVNSHRDGV